MNFLKKYSASVRRSIIIDAVQWAYEISNTLHLNPDRDFEINIVHGKAPHPSFAAMFYSHPYPHIDLFIDSEVEIDSINDWIAILAHEIRHVYQYYHGREFFRYNYTDREIDANNFARWFYSKRLGRQVRLGISFPLVA